MAIYTLVLSLLPLAALRAQTVPSPDAVEPPADPVEVREVQTPPTLDPALQAYAEDVLGKAVVDNSASDAGVKPRRPVREAYGGAFLRIAQWNVNNQPAAVEALTRPDRYKGSLQLGDKAAEAGAELDALLDADILVLNETGFDLVQRLARDGGYNYAFGAAVVDLDPTAAQLLRAGRPPQAVLHGNAVLSRYRIRSAESDPLESYDWNGGELRPLSPLEKARRLGARLAVKESIETQPRAGLVGRFRNAVVAVVEVPEAPGGVWTVAATQFENYAPPKLRRREMRELLARLKAAPGRVALIGDLNTMGNDFSPTSLRKEGKNFATDPQRIATTGARIAAQTGVPVVGPALTGASVLHHVRRHNDPTIHGIPLIGRNKERGLFADVERFRFDDGRGFDTSAGDDRTAPGRGGKFAGTNERDWKGFKETYRTERSYGAPIWVGREKLDWIFSKDAGELNSRCPRTLSGLARSSTPRLSDHNPIYADFPLQAPPPGASCR